MGVTEAEVGSGLGGRRRRLLRLLADPTVSPIVMEHRDRLARFGVEDVEAALAACGRRLVVVDPAETTDDLGRDMVDVPTSLCARLYGRRSARTRAAKGASARRRRRPQQPGSLREEGWPHEAAHVRDAAPG